MFIWAVQIEELLLIGTIIREVGCKRGKLMQGGSLGVGFSVGWSRVAIASQGILCREKLRGSEVADCQKGGICVFALIR